jgi:exopolysaccharide biosynthesis protein
MRNLLYYQKGVSKASLFGFTPKSPKGDLLISSFLSTPFRGQGVITEAFETPLQGVLQNRYLWLLKELPATLLLLLLLQQPIVSQIKGFNKVKWEKEKIAPGLVWKSSHTMLQDTSPQNINLLYVNLRKRNISIHYHPEKNILTSKQALDADAVAALNAGFFNVKEGGSVTYIRTGGKIPDTDTAKKWTRNANMTGALAIEKGKKLTVMEAKSNGWFDSHAEFEDVLVTGPLLILGDKKISLPNTSLVVTRHPRSCIGLINKHKIVLVTLDGRTPEAHGMSLTELADLMKSLKCRDAVNLDGGGSTTMWLKGKPNNGVMNMPCDNKKFDHEGERTVSDIIIVR